VPAGFVRQHLGELAGQFDAGGATAADDHGCQRRCCSGSADAEAVSSAVLTAAHTRSASLAEYSDSVRWATPG
jgi:hypothetical protein